MQERGGGHLRLHDHLDGLWKHLVGILAALTLRCAAALFLLRGGLPVDLLDNLVVIISLFLPLDEIHDRFYLTVGEEAALDAHGLGDADGAEEHIAVAEQLLSAGHIEDRARIHLRGDGQCDPARDICLDDAGNHVDGWALCGNHQMHARRTRHLGEAADGILHLIGSGHHQVGQFVNENDDARQRLFLRILFAELIVAHHIAHVIVREELIAVEHLRHRPAECARRLARIGHDGHQQVRNAVIDAQLDLLRVDHEELYLIGARIIEDADDH